MSETFVNATRVMNGVTANLEKKVLVWIASPCDFGHARSINALLPTHAEIGNPPDIALPRQMISGTVFVCSHANQRPVRPKPV